MPPRDASRRTLRIPAALVFTTLGASPVSAALACSGTSTTRDVVTTCDEPDASDVTDRADACGASSSSEPPVTFDA
jgi:hypothetical protein